MLDAFIKLLIVADIVSAIFVIFLVLLQQGQGGGMGGLGLGAGGAESAFGAKAPTVLGKATALFGAFFMLSNLLLFVLAKNDTTPEELAETAVAIKKGDVPDSATSTTGHPEPPPDTPASALEGQSAGSPEEGAVPAETLKKPGEAAHIAEQSDGSNNTPDNPADHAAAQATEDKKPSP